MKNDTNIPASVPGPGKVTINGKDKEFAVRIDQTDMRYKIFEYEAGVWVPVATFNYLNDSAARRVREILDKGQGGRNAVSETKANSITL